jgi:uncharacterized protein YndB with AHSA1/START domain
MTAIDSADGRATKTRQTFRMQCGVAINIQAEPEKIWALLTNAAGFPRWNSTVQSIEGQIALGQKIRLRVPVAPKRVFKLKVSAFEPGKRMVWQDGAPPMFKGVRTFTLTPRDNGSIDFAMVEVFSGLMLPMIAGSLPDFAPSFERYAADLKRAAEQP